MKKLKLSWCLQRTLSTFGFTGALVSATQWVEAAPVVSRLTPPSALFTFNDPGKPYIARFLPDQRFDLQATVRPDAGQIISEAVFFVDGSPVPGSVSTIPATVAGLP